MAQAPVGTSPGGAVEDSGVVVAKVQELDALIGMFNQHLAVLALLALSPSC